MEVYYSVEECGWIWLCIVGYNLYILGNFNKKLNEMNIKGEQFSFLKVNTEKTGILNIQSL